MFFGLGDPEPGAPTKKILLQIKTEVVDDEEEEEEGVGTVGREVMPQQVSVLLK